MISRPIFMQFCKPLQHILLQGATKLVCYCIVQGLLLTTGRCGQLKPRQNKKGQSFVVMLDFFMSFFEFASAACSKKKCKSQESEQIFSCSYFVGNLSNMQLFKLLFYWFGLLKVYYCHRTKTSVSNTAPKWVHL